MGAEQGEGMARKGCIPGKFEIGLCMAGAISAGAYTAGVVDFLIEALEAWQQVKNAEKGLDPKERSQLSHDAVITCMSGASAGGMTAAALAAGLCGRYEPVNDLSLGVTPRQTNIPYSCWVESVDIDDFLGLEDLLPLPGGDDPVVRSLLDCTILDSVAEAMMKPDGSAPQPRPYIAQELELFLSLANLRGVPYQVRFKGTTNYGHEMIQHQDNIHFRLTRTDPGQPGGVPGHYLERVPPIPGAFGDSLYWNTFRTAALATGAFPLALLPRVLQREVLEYDSRKWFIPRGVTCTGTCTEDTENNPPYTGQIYGMEAQLLRQSIRQGRMGINLPDEFSTLNVDGGAFDNEPLELARRFLAGGALMNPREPEKACRAVVLIDPFPHSNLTDDSATYGNLDVLGLAGKIVGALKANARFKAEELVLAQDEDCYSRFLIGPSRTKARESESDIACGSLGGFGGFFSRKFRQHDYLLGRRNCQRFLQNHFVIPLEAARINPCFTAEDRQRMNSFAYAVTENGVSEDVVPIIPLMPSVHPDTGGEAKIPAWAAVQIRPEEVDALRPLIVKRLKRVADIYVNKYLGGFKGKLVKMFFLNAKIEELADSLLSKVHEDFRKAGVE